MPASEIAAALAKLARGDVPLLLDKSKREPQGEPAWTKDKPAPAARFERPERSDKAERPERFERNDDCARIKPNGPRFQRKSGLNVPPMSA